eukprot:Tbor_TRINITY_DN1277_c0_g1::TRINITY_DN1277_c0_g1_i1::g.5777::m.5777
MSRSNSQVAEIVCTALHTEIVLYVVNKYAHLRNSTEGSELDPFGQLVPSGDVIFHTIENMGIHVGLRLTERLTHREPLANFTPEVVTKFIAGPVWVAIFGKVIEYQYSQDVSELVDRNFHWIRSCSFKTGDEGSVAACAKAASNFTHVAPGYDLSGNQLSATVETKNKEVNVLKRENGMSCSVVDPESTAEAGPADFVVFASGIIRGVLQSLGHPHVTVTFQLSVTEGSTPLGADENSGVKHSTGIQNVVPHPDLLSSFVNLCEVQFALDFSVEKELMANG